MNEAILPYLPFLLAAAKALAVFAAGVFAFSWLAARLLFVLPAFEALGAYLVRPSASAYDNADANFAYNSADPRSADSRNAVMGAFFCCFVGWLTLGIACMMLLVDPYIPYVNRESPSFIMRVAVCVVGVAIVYVAYRFLLVLLAQELSPEDLAAVRAKWKAITRRAD